MCRYAIGGYYYPTARNNVERITKNGGSWQTMASFPRNIHRQFIWYADMIMRWFCYDDPKRLWKATSTSRKKTGIAPLWTKVMTESTFLEATIVVTQGARFTTTPYLPIHGAITGVKGFWWLSILLLMMVGLRLKIFHVKPLIEFHWKILFKWFTASFCGPHSWTLHVGLLPRRMGPGWSLAIIIIFVILTMIMTMGMIMIMTIVTFPGGCCTSRETTGAGSFTGISQTTMGDFYLLHRPGFIFCLWSPLIHWPLWSVGTMWVIYSMTTGNNIWAWSRWGESHVISAPNDV